MNTAWNFALLQKRKRAREEDMARLKARLVAAQAVRSEPAGEQSPAGH